MTTHVLILCTHNSARSVLSEGMLNHLAAQLGNQNNFHRLRLGIGHPGHASLVSGYVLGRAPRSEQELLDKSIDFALDVLPEILAGDWTVAMRKLHSQKATK